MLETPGPIRPAAGATQRDAALVLEDFTEALASCNADKHAIAEIFREYEDGMVGRPD